MDFHSCPVTVPRSNPNYCLVFSIAKIWTLKCKLLTCLLYWLLFPQRFCSQKPFRCHSLPKVCVGSPWMWHLTAHCFLCVSSLLVCGKNSHWVQLSSVLILIWLISHFLVLSCGYGGGCCLRAPRASSDSSLLSKSYQVARPFSLTHHCLSSLALQVWPEAQRS